MANNGDAVVAVNAASVNPSDLKNVAGAMKGTILPRIPGRDFSGVVLDGPHDWIGAEVWGTGGDVGFTRDGSHAQLLAIPAEALARKPKQLSFEEASVVGVNFVVGWLGAVETAQLGKGETIAVFGVSGGVGGAVAQIAALGARVIGVDRVKPAHDAPAASIIEEFVASDGSPHDIGFEIQRLSAGHGADVVYDAVGGVTTQAALASLAHRGRLAQLVGSLLGVPAARAVWGPVAGRPPVSDAVLQPGLGWSAGALFAAETASMAVIVLLVGLFLSAARLAPLVPWLVGLLIGMAIALRGTTTGGSVNPARQFGPAVASGRLDFLWVYLLAPMVGAVLATSLHKRIMKRRCLSTYRLCGTHSDGSPLNGSWPRWGPGDKTTRCPAGLSVPDVVTGQCTALGVLGASCVSGAVEGVGVVGEDERAK